MLIFSAKEFSTVKYSQGRIDKGEVEVDAGVKKQLKVDKQGDGLQ